MKHQRARVSLSIALLFALLAWGARPSVGAQSPNRVGLVVQFGDGTTVTRCVPFTEPEISGYDILLRSGLDVVASYDSGAGAAICTIEGEGCSAGDCFCQCRGSTCVYWSYWHLDGGAWIYAPIGGTMATAHNGDVDGWRWGEGEPPPILPFDQICAPPPTAPPPRPSATATPPPPPEPEAWFRLDQNPIAPGTCTTLRWDTWHAHAVYLDGERVALIGSREVCPAAPQAYWLRAAGSEAEVTHELVLGVTGATQATPAPSEPPPTIAPPSPTAGTAVVGPSPTLQPPPTPPPATSATLAPTPTSSASPTSTFTPVSTAPPPTSHTVASSAASPTRTVQGGQARPTPASTDAPAPSAGGAVPAGYAVFALLGGSLLGWLIVERRRRR